MALRASERRIVEPTDLLGTWRFERRIVQRDPRAQDRRFGRVEGTMTLRAVTTEVRWSEQGTLWWGGQALAVSRTLRVIPSAGAWTVCFEDGRPFHPWRPGEPVEHPCRDDAYRGLVDIDAACERLRVVWDVAGPHKDRRLFTRARRTGS